MSQFASVQSLDALKDLRVGMVGFGEAARAAVAEAERDVSRTLAWLENEQKSHWTLQHKKRQEALQRAMEDLRKKTLYRGVDGTQRGDVDERRAVARAKQAVQEAEEKLKAVKQWRTKLEREAMTFRGLMQSISREAEDRVPAAIARLDRMADALDKYVALQSPTRAGDARATDEAASVARGSTEDAGASGGDSGGASGGESEDDQPEDKP